MIKTTVASMKGWFDELERGLILHQVSSMSAEARFSFYDSLSSAVSAGSSRSIIKTLTTVRSAYQSDEPRDLAVPLLTLLITSVRKQGTALWESMKGLLPAAEILLIRAGEEAEQLSVGLSNAGKIARDFDEIQNEIRKGLLKPGFYILGAWLTASAKDFSLANMAVISKDVITTAKYIAISNAYNSWFYFMNIIFFLIVVHLITYVFGKDRIFGPVRVVLDKLPPYNMYRLRTGVQLMQSLSLMVKSMPAPEALRKISETSDGYLARLVDDCLIKVRQDGVDPLVALAQSGLFQGRMSILFRFAAKDPDQLEQNLDKFSVQSMKMAKSSSESILSVFRTASFIAMMVSVLLMAGAMMMTMEFAMEVSTGRN